jgi:hypothetical protein
MATLLFLQNRSSDSVLSLGSFHRDAAFIERTNLGMDVIPRNLGMIHFPSLSLPTVADG